jgi:hypothetical protein
MERVLEVISTMVLAEHGAQMKEEEKFTLEKFLAGSSIKPLTKT